MLQGTSVADRILSNPSSDARSAIDQLGQDRSTMLLHHVSGEILRTLRNTWEPLQLVMSVLLIVLFLFTDSRKPIAIGMVVIMAALTLVQRSFLTPEWNYLGQQFDFAQAPQSFKLETQLWSVTRSYAGVEVLKLLLGGALASYLFAMESVVKRGRSRRSESSASAASLSR